MAVSNNQSPQDRLRIGIDIGGTFTDFVVFREREGTLRRFKFLSTPSDPAQAVVEGLQDSTAEGIRTIVHGSTVATNALLERKGACSALVTTKGFRDILAIGRQTRTELYDFFSDRPDPLIPSHRCWEVTERVDYQGKVLIPLNQTELDRLTHELREQGVEAVAVSLLFSFVYPSHEQLVAERLRKEGFFVTASHELLPEFREYERTSTTAVNVYVSPILSQYLSKLKKTCGQSAFHILQSNGGRLSLDQAQGQGVRAILSGPAGGVVGAKYVANLAGYEQVLTFDMGGTSTDVSMINGNIAVTTGAKVGGLPIRVPVIDIHTVGSGGGSIAYTDPGGSLRVGPQSAGAHPGPVCYGWGGEHPTVTDANLVLGRLPVDGFLGGTMALDYPKATDSLTRLGKELCLDPKPGLNLCQTIALGIVEVVNAHMEGALRVMSVERGHDPRDCVLVSFGGAGGLHACDLARQLRIPQVLIPPMAATLSALGMLTADVQLDYVQTVMLPGDVAYGELEHGAERLVHQGWMDLKGQGVDSSCVTMAQTLDIRYVGQSYELEVPLTPMFRKQFDVVHQERYGYCREEGQVEIVNIRVRAIGYTSPPPLRSLEAGPPDSSETIWCHRAVVLPEGVQDVAHYHGTRLRAGHQVSGPALIIQEDTTIYLGLTDKATVDRYQNLVIDVGS